MKKILFFIFLVSFFNTTSFAGENVNGREITDIGCHSINGTCYVTLSGDSFGTTLGCANTATHEFRFDDADTTNGKRAYASLLAAFLTNKTVDIFLDGCTSQGAPKLQYFHVR
ncbi:hypothetical protein IC797_11670 [Acinetobacter seifertii]|uniref:hypothetical protein n=1 Tax=Acinetobacter seifertii TaxID=1530123 RepID=UPI00168CD323|nr:hypothetical protein [Acinetobacter seifertii]QNW97025.1 hypothetical protein IC797_11670 [Acinetobacter seifertii]